MALLLEFFLFLVRVILLATGSYVIYYFGIDLYQVFAALHAPCVELLSLFIALVPVIALWYGTLHRRYFWQRTSQVNWIIVMISFVIAFIFTYLPAQYLAWLDMSLVNCQGTTTLADSISRFLFTGILVSVLSFVGMDMGVGLKHISHHLQTKSSKKPKHSK